MFRLTLILAVSLYASFMIWGDPADYAGAEAATEPSTTANTATARHARPVILGAPTDDSVDVTRGETAEIVVPDPATIAASAPAPAASWAEPTRIGEPVVISLVRPTGPGPAPAPEVAPEPVPEADMLRVTGTVVNMRAGPSTGNAVIDSLPRGTLAEALGEPQNGWQQIRNMDTGQTGWMAARFLEPS